MTQPAPRSQKLGPAVEAFAEFVARVDDGEAVDFDAFCAEREELGPELRRIHARWQAMAGPLQELPGSSASLLGPRADESTERFVAALAESTPSSDRYELRGEIARGGMGSIVEAWDRILRRAIAMKVLRGSAATGRQLGRFLDEAQVTGQLDHPGIVPVHEMGVDAEDRVYFTMPLIRGRHFGQIIKASRHEQDGWSIPAALGVIRRVCEAMAYAHDKGVVHRDLKPANIMVGRFGETYVMDWGLARVLSQTMRETRAQSQTESAAIDSHRKEALQQDADSPLQTSAGDVVGTPAYMAPEQARGETGSVGAAADIYSVGAVLYHLLAGHAPHLHDGTQASDTVLARARKGPPPSLGSLCPEVSAELVAITERAMSWRPEQRYPSMLALADDLRAFLEGRVVSARETGQLGRLWKWVLRNPGLATASGIAIASLLIGLAVSLGLYFEARAQAGRANANAARFAEELSASNVERGRLSAATGNLAHAEDLIWKEHFAARNRTRTTWALWDLYQHQPCLVSRQAHTDRIPSAMFGPDDSWLITAGFDRSIRTWDARTLQPLSTVGSHDAQILCMDLNPNGKEIAIGDVNGRIAVWDLQEPRARFTLDAHKGRVNWLAYAVDGHGLASGGADGAVRLWSLAARTSILLGSHANQVARVAFDKSGSLLASTSADGTARLWDVKHNKPVGIPLTHRENATALVFSNDGTQLFTGCTDRKIRIWDVATQKLTATLEADNGNVYSLLVSPDGETLYSSGFWRVDCWDLESRAIRRSMALRDSAFCLGLDRAGTTLVSAHSTGELRLWDLAADRSVRSLGGHDTRVSVACDSSGGVVATGDYVGRVRLWEPGTGRVRELAKTGTRVKSLCFDPAGGLLAAGDVGGHLRIWRVSDGTLLRTIANHMAASCNSVAFGPTGDVLAFTTRAGHVEIRDVMTDQVLAAWRADDREVINLAFDPTGGTIVTAGRGGLKLWSSNGSLLHEFRAETVPWSVVFSPDGRYLVCGKWSKTILVFDARTRQLVRRLEGHSGAVWCVAFSPADPELLASIGADRSLRLWDVRTGQNIVTLEDAGLALGFSADGQTLVAGGTEGRAFAWDLGYFERHVAGNLDFQRARLAPKHEFPRLDSWAREVLSRPWPRWSR